jgi:hypothetical protein
MNNQRRCLSRRKYLAFGQHNWLGVQSCDPAPQETNGLRCTKMSIKLDRSVTSMI